MEARRQRGGEDRRPAGEGGRDALIDQRLVEIAREGAGPGQDADRGVGDDRFLQLRLPGSQGFRAGARSLQLDQHARDFIDDVGRLVLVEDADGSADAVQELGFDGRARVVLRAVGDLDFGEGFRAEERAFLLPVGEQAVEEGDEVLRRAVILVEAQLLLGLGDDLLVVVDVRAAETVDGLLPVADHDEQLGVGVRRAVAEGLLEDLPLLGVRVLGFIDQAGVEVRPDAGAELLAAHRVAEGVQQVLDDGVEGEQASGGPELGQAARDEPAQAGTLQLLGEAYALVRALVLSQQQLGGPGDLLGAQRKVRTIAGRLPPEVGADGLSQGSAVLGRPLDGREARGRAVLGVGPVAEGVDRGDLHRRKLLEGGGRAFLLEQFPHALPHLERGGVGEGHEQYPRDVAAFLGHLLDDADEVVGLAGAGPCFDDDESRVEREGGHFQGRGSHRGAYFFLGVSTLKSAFRPLSLRRCAPAKAFCTAVQRAAGSNRDGASNRPKRSWMSPAV